ncbi:Plant transposase [Quillaja saponaria]|uniref:Plant transposase n=1 Tax=Quillaja saponaria TaxID=32244 RepID=A0AAD7LVU1_QUISA|nr:Plant transposase [Quillaja saponaria]
MQTAVHTPGSLSFALNQAEKKGRHVQHIEVFLETHVMKDGNFVDSRSKRVATTFENVREQPKTQRIESDDLFTSVVQEDQKKSHGRVYGKGKYAKLPPKRGQPSSS